MCAKKRKRIQEADDAVRAYKAVERRFDPLGSYTGRTGSEAPSQDADDL